MPSIEKILKSWLPYSPIGNQVPGTRFIAFKVPLREAFVDKLKPEDRFTIGILLDKIPDLGLVIDLTNTSKYYNKREFLDRGVDYVKIPTPGQTIPPQHLVDRFFEVIDYYLDTHDNDNTLIGIHCTHGVNRTGYMLCRYLIQRLEYPFGEAIEAVGRARGHMIERSPYIASLQDNVESVQKKSNSVRSIEGSIPKLKKEAEPKKEETRRRGSGKERVRGENDFRSSPGRQAMAPPVRQVPVMRTRSPPLQQPPRGRTPPITIRARPNSPIYVRPSTGQHRLQATLIRDRMAPPMPHGRSPPPVHPREPDHYRDLTPPPPRINSHYPPVSMRDRTPPSNVLRERSPHRVQGRVRSPMPVMIDHIPSRGRSPSHLRGRSPSRLRGGPPTVRVRSRSPRYRTGRTPPPTSRGRSPGRSSARGRTPPQYRPPSPLHTQMPPSSNPSLVHGHPSRRDQLPSSRVRSPPPSRGREPTIHSRRERSPPVARTSKRPHSPDYRRNEPPVDPYYEMRYGYEDNRKPVEDIPREFTERYEPRDFYSSDRVHGSTGDYYPERYEKPRRERSVSPRRHQSYYPTHREGKSDRPEFSPPREKRRRKSPVAEVREKVRRASPPSGYLNSDDGLKRDKRSRDSFDWEQVKNNDGPDCREILNEKRSLRDVYPESRPPVYTDTPKYPASNSDLRDVLEEEKRRRHGHSETSNYRGDNPILDERDSRVRQNYSSHGYQSRPDVDRDRGRPRQDYEFNSGFEDTLARSERQHHQGYQDEKLYTEVLNHQAEEGSIKARDEEFRKPRRTRGGVKHRFFERNSKGGGRSRGGYRT